MPNVTGVRKQRAAKRLARVRLNNPKALKHVDPSDGYTPREARRIKTVDARQKARQAKRKASEPASGFNPLAPLTGEQFKKETAAAEKLEFGPRARELREEIGRADQSALNTGTYFDDYKRVLGEATARINATNSANVTAAEGRVDTAHTEDAARVAASDAKAAESAKARGVEAAPSAEGAKAVAAQRSQGDQAVAGLRSQAGADTSLMEKRGATSVLAKGEALARETARRRGLSKNERELAADRGAFRTAARTKARESERSYAAIRKEFGLKTKELQLKTGDTAADRKLERQKLAAQKRVAGIYASADKAGAKAQIEVARLQLKKGRITKNQYKKIEMIYKGLGNDGKKAPDTKPKLQTWERDKVTNAIRILDDKNALPRDKTTWLKRMESEGVPLRLARRAWAQYVKQQNKAVNQSPGGDSNQ
jgi:hypothetical protein